MKASLLTIITLSLVFALGCATSHRGFNDPSEEGYDANYPIRLRPVLLPAEYDGMSPICSSESFALFTPSKWKDPQEYYNLAQNAAMKGDWSAQAIVNQEPKDSVKQICDDNLVVLKAWLFLARDRYVIFREGTFRFYFADGTSTLDCGVRVNMSRDLYDPVGDRRSYESYPLKIGREQIISGQDGVAVVFLFDRRYYNKEVVRAELVEENYSLLQK